MTRRSSRRTGPIRRRSVSQRRVPGSHGPPALRIHAELNRPQCARGWLLPPPCRQNPRAGLHNVEGTVEDTKLIVTIDLAAIHSRWEDTAATLVELLAAVPAPEPMIALCCQVRPLGHRP